MHCAMQALLPSTTPVQSPLVQQKLYRCAQAFSTSTVCCHKRAVTQVRASRAQQAPASAEAAVEQGLEAFAKGDTSEALELFRRSMSMNPSRDEARAALYNSACCLTKEKQWQAATDAVTEAINNYGLKYAVAQQVRPSLQHMPAALQVLPVCKSIDLHHHLLCAS